MCYDVHQLSPLPARPSSSISSRLLSGLKPKDLVHPLQERSAAGADKDFEDYRKGHRYDLPCTRKRFAVLCLLTLAAAILE